MHIERNEVNSVVDITLDSAPLAAMSVTRTLRIDEDVPVDLDGDGRLIRIDGMNPSKRTGSDCEKGALALLPHGQWALRSTSRR